ncbi:MAG: restriction endonuclease subunit S [Verrucomicrobiales bacterium]|nr:restriction endonuclease subunit S [Verrucomicrobiales bacterium]
MSFPRYPEYKDSGVEWLGEVPGHWEVKRVGALFREVNETGNESLPILCVSIHDGVSDRELDENEMDRKVTRSDDRSKYKKVRPGDLVYNMMRAWQGGFGAVSVEGMVSPAYVVARPIGNVPTPVVEQLLRTPNAVEEMRRYSRGVTDFRLRLYWDEFKNLSIVLPPEREQTAIAAFLDRETAKIDALVAEQRRLIELLKEKRQAVISHAVTKGLNPDAPMKDSGIEWLGEVPTHWEVKPLRRFSCLVQSGPFGSQLHADEYVRGGVPVINPTNMVEGSVVPNDEITVTDAVANRLSHQRLRAGDVIFSRRGELGRCALITETEEGWLCGTGSMILRLHQSEYHAGYLSHFLSLGVMRQYFQSYSIGSVMDSLSSATLLCTPMVVPPIDEQGEISAFIGRESAKFDTLTAEAQRAIDLLQERRTALISAAVTGQIDVRHLSV